MTGAPGLLDVDVSIVRHGDFGDELPKLWRSSRRCLGSGQGVKV